MKKYILVIGVIVSVVLNAFSQKENNCTNNVSTNPSNLNSFKNINLKND
jgi:hypothetical protein